MPRVGSDVPVCLARSGYHAKARHVGLLERIEPNVRGDNDKCGECSDELAQPAGATPFGLPFALFLIDTGL